MGKTLGRWVMQLLASAGKGAIAAKNSCVAAGSAGLDFTVGVFNGALNTVRNALGSTGPAPVPQPSKGGDALAEALEANAPKTEMVWEEDFTAEEQSKQAEMVAQHRALTLGLEPKDVHDYATAGSKKDREKVAEEMRSKTKGYVMHLSNEQLDTLGRAGVDGIKHHLSNIKHIPGVPKYTFGADYSGKELSHKEPKPTDFGKAKSNYFGKRNELIAAATPAQEQTFAPTGFHKQLEMQKDRDNNSAPSFQPKAAGMRR